MATDKSTDSDKVFDVAKPDAAKPDTGSKPMVIGHKSLASDPSMREASTPEKDDDTDAPDKAAVRSSSKIKITPINADEKPSSEEPQPESEPSTDTESNPETDDAKSETTKEEKSKTDQAESKEDDSKSSEPAKDPEAQGNQSKDSKEGDEVKADDPAAVREKKLQEMIASKEYVVPIKTSHGGGIGSFLVTLVIVALIGLVVGVVLIDTEMVNTTIQLPFDLL